MEQRRRGASVKAELYDMVKYANVLYTLRAKVKKQQTEIAAMIGCSQSQWARNETGNVRQISLDFVDRVCSTFNIPRDTLLVPLDKQEKLDPAWFKILQWANTSEAKPYIEEAYRKFKADEEMALIKKAREAVLKN